MSNCKVIALTNQKGGVGKTTTAVNLGVALAQQGKKVLLIDADAQANLTMSLGYSRPDDLPDTRSTIMQDIIDDKPVDVSRSILHHDEGVDLLPSNIELSGLEVRLINAISRESVLKTCINEVKKNYDTVLVDCMPSLGMLTINALAAADSVVIPTQPHYLSAKGLELLLRSVSKVKRQINPHLRIFDYIYDEHNNKKAVLNHKETTAAQAKQEMIKQAFQDWIWKDPERRNRLVRYYNDTFNSIRPREYDGSHITFGGISPEIQLRPHQVNAIAHILYGGNTLLAHKVGAGKTFEMVAAAQESKRLGLCQKSMFVVPNHLVGQWASEYLRLYPSANILVTTKRDFETGNRKKFCGRIATGAYDAVIIGHSQFEKIPISEERQREQLMRQLDDIEMGMEREKALDLIKKLRDNFTASAKSIDEYAASYPDIPLGGKAIFEQQRLLYQSLLEWLDKFESQFRGS